MKQKTLKPVVLGVLIISQHIHAAKLTKMTWGQSYLEHQHSRTHKTSVIRNDFLINDDIRGDAIQFRPTVGFNNDKAIVVWTDLRNTFPVITGQFYSADGVKIDTNFWVHDPWTYPIDSDFAPVSMDTNGNFVIVWSTWEYIYAQRFLSTGEPLGGPLIINDDPNFAQTWGPPPLSVALNNSGKFVVTWRDDRNAGIDPYDTDIYMQVVLWDGTLLGANQRVNEENEYPYHETPFVSVNDEGYFVIVWKEESYTGYPPMRISGQIYDPQNTPVGNNFEIAPDASAPCVALNNNSFVATYSSGFDILAQIFDLNGQPITGSFYVNGSASHSYNTAPYVASNSQGYFTIAWISQDRSDTPWLTDIFARLYSPQGTPITSDFRVNSLDCYLLVFPSDRPCVAVNELGNSIIAWQQGTRNLDFDIYCRFLDGQGNFITQDLCANSDTASSDQFDPSIAIDTSGNITIVFTDERNSNYDIYFQRMDKDGNFYGTNTRLEVDPDTSEIQVDPEISITPDGYFNIVWIDYRTTRGLAQIYAQNFSPDGTPVTQDFHVAEDMSGPQVEPSVTSDWHHTFVTTWSDLRNSARNLDVYVRRYDLNGVPLSPDILVNDDNTPMAQDHPDVASDSAGNYVVVWEDYRNGSPPVIYAQLFDNQNNPVGTNFAVNENWSSGFTPAVARSPQGTWVAAWRDFSADIYCRVFDSNGAPLTSQFKVNSEEQTSNGFPDIAFSPDGTKFVVMWVTLNELGYFRQTFARTYLIDGTPLSNPTPIGDIAWDYQLQYGSLHSGVAASNDRIIFAWADNRRHKGKDVFAQISDWNLVSVEERAPDYIQVPLKCLPNPSKGNLTFIGAVLPLKLYDLAGRLVMKLNTRVWNGRLINSKKVSPGFYIAKDALGRTVKLQILR